MKALEKSEKVSIIAIIVLIGFIFAVVYNYVLGFYGELNFPFNSFLWPLLSGQPFSDFSYTLDLIKNLAPFQHTNDFLCFFPLAYVIMFPFTLIKNKILAYIIYASFFIIFFGYNNIKQLSCKNLSKTQNFQNIFIITLISYPFLMLIDRGNFDLLLFIMFAGFVYLFKMEKYLMSALLLGITAATKPFFFIFLVLFLFKKRFKEILFSLTASILLIIGGFTFFHGDVFQQMANLIINLRITKNIYLFNENMGSLAQTSLYMPLKFSILYTPMRKLIPLNEIIQFYNCLSMFIAGIATYFAYREKTYWKKIALILLCMLALPYFMNDYKLIFLFVPLWLFVNENEKSKFDLAYTVLFGLLLASKSIIFASSFVPPFDWIISLSTILNPLIIIAFISLIIFDQLKTKTG